MLVERQALRDLRVDQVGSLVRPTWLLNTFKRFDDGQLSEDELRHAQDVSIRDLIAKQEKLGFPILTDGEHRRHNFQDSFGECVTGFANGRPIAIIILLLAKLMITASLQT